MIFGRHPKEKKITIGPLSSEIYELKTRIEEFRLVLDKREKILNKKGDSNAKS